jgi:hypothetical protein
VGGGVKKSFAGIRALSSLAQGSENGISFLSKRIKLSEKRVLFFEGNIGGNKSFNVKYQSKI